MNVIHYLNNEFGREKKSPSDFVAGKTFFLMLQIMTQQNHEVRMENASACNRFSPNLSISDSLSVVPKRFLKKIPQRIKPGIVLYMMESKFTWKILSSEKVWDASMTE